MRLQLTLQPANADFDSVSNRAQTHPCSLSVILLYLLMFARGIVQCICVSEMCAHSRCDSSYLGCILCDCLPTLDRHVSARSLFCPAFFALCAIALTCPPFLFWSTGGQEECPVVIGRQCPNSWPPKVSSSDAATWCQSGGFQSLDG
jgi:hypothetical protein